MLILGGSIFEALRQLRDQGIQVRGFLARLVQYRPGREQVRTTQARLLHFRRPASGDRVRGFAHLHQGAVVEGLQSLRLAPRPDGQALVVDTRRGQAEPA
ncbi:MAG: hypothetical protein A3H91_04135 [Gammaproteobacteria bacterium RIFCSPLOWO2_02_FULL_61_13]|nr:MAG: hypothetical protein A3H91_04135 [Gammaproteobacteria bacterium RIFCSPLOWO2_02_FULL_61_13]